MIITIYTMYNLGGMGVPLIKMQIEPFFVKKNRPIYGIILIAKK